MMIVGLFINNSIFCLKHNYNASINVFRLIGAC